MRLPCIPMLMALGIGLALNNGIAVLEALVGHASTFERTPKYNIASRLDSWRNKKYRAFSCGWQIVLEVLLGAYCCCGMMFSLRFGVYASLPFQFLLFFGFAYMGSLSLIQKKT